MENKDIYNKIKKEVLNTYPQNGINIIIPGKDNNTLIQLTSTINEQKSLNGLNQTYLNENNNISKINLKNCESTLKKAYNISENEPLIVLKY
jgi:hypothetical protein